MMLYAHSRIVNYGILPVPKQGRPFRCGEIGNSADFLHICNAEKGPDAVKRHSRIHRQNGFSGGKAYVIKGLGIFDFNKFDQFVLVIKEIQSRDSLLSHNFSQIIFCGETACCLSGGLNN